MPVGSFPFPGGSAATITSSTQGAGFPASGVDVCSNALIKLGDSPITSFDDSSDRARVMAHLYLPTLVARLRDHNWNFATFRVALAQLEATPPFDYGYMYQLPQDPRCVMVLTTDLDEDQPWEVENYQTGNASYRVIVTDATAVSIKYIGLLLDVTKWDPLFTEAMETELAFRAGYAITRNAELVNLLAQEQKEGWRKARSRDGQEGRPLRKAKTSAWTAVR
jgi:hypothetical protein